MLVVDLRDRSTHGRAHSLVAYGTVGRLAKKVSVVVVHVSATLSASLLCARLLWHCANELPKAQDTASWVEVCGDWSRFGRRQSDVPLCVSVSILSMPSSLRVRIARGLAEGHGLV